MLISGRWGGRGCVGVGAVHVVGVWRSRWLVWRSMEFCDEGGIFFYNSDMQNSKTVMTGEAVDKLWMSCG